MLVTLIRHAPTRGNLLSNYVGFTDEPLSDEGVALARRVPPAGNVGKVYASPLRRAEQTAAILYPGAERVLRAGLAEMNFGVFEGRNWRELEADAAYRDWLSSGCEARCPGGESKQEFSRRCRRAFAEMVEGELAAGAAELHVVAHGGVIMAVMDGFVDSGRGYFSWKADYCGGYRFGCRDEGGVRTFSLIGKIEPPGSGGTP